MSTSTLVGLPATAGFPLAATLHEPSSTPKAAEMFWGNDRLDDAIQACAEQGT
ncbi:MAG: hypothetical protein Q8Q73_17985 [Stagnimonas sp.]|nr:hypothetical protein [Stagnimonas sp.]